MNFELVARGDSFTCVEKHVREEEKHPLLVALTREFVQTALTDELLQEGIGIKDQL